MDPANRTRVLCVDDEPNVVEALSLHLRRRFDVTVATSGAEALALIRTDPSIAVIVSDMRMPGMNGAEFLKAARGLNADSVRILLTGQADVDSAIAAINDGRIFRFLTKPCPPAALLAAIEAAAAQHRLVTAERILLEQTLRGSIKALVNVLALTSPTAFGRANRVRRLAIGIAERMGMADHWQLEVAAMLSQLGYIILPAEVAERAYYGIRLPESERRMAARVPEVTEQLLANIPRLETVREILATYHGAAPREAASAGAPGLFPLILRAAIDFDVLESQGSSAAVAVETMRHRAGTYDPGVLEALTALRAGNEPRVAVRDVTLAELREGMIVAVDLKMANGTLLAARGYEITDSFVERAHNFRPGMVREPVRVVVPAAVKEEA